MVDILTQCKNLYITAFGDDGDFKDKLFEKFFNPCCRFIEQDGTVVCMAFFLDCFANGKKGKYLYAVTTHLNYRKKGFMTKLFSLAEKEFRGEYEFFCLHPASASLAEGYKKLGFEQVLCNYTAETKLKTPVLIKTAEQLKNVRKSIGVEKSIEFDAEVLELLLLYTNAYCDSLNNPSALAIIQKDGSKLEYLTKQKMQRKESMSMVKSFGNTHFKDFYLGITLQ